MPQPRNNYDAKNRVKLRAQKRARSLGKSLAAVYREAGVNKAYLNDEPKTGWNINKLTAIAKALGWSLAELLNGSDSEPAKKTTPDAKKETPAPAPVARRPRHYLREWREVYGLSLQAMSDAFIPFREGTLKFTQAYLSRIETGKQRYNQTVLEAYAEALHCTVGELFSPPPDPLGWFQSLTFKEQAQVMMRETGQITSPQDRPSAQTRSAPAGSPGSPASPSGSSRTGSPAKRRRKGSE